MYTRPPPLRKKSGIFSGEVASVHRLQRVGEGIRKYIALYNISTDFADPPPGFALIIKLSLLTRTQ